MKQYIKNKYTHKVAWAAAASLDYCGDPKTKSHGGKGVTLTPRRTQGPTTKPNFVRDNIQLRNAYQYQRRFARGKKFNLLDEWIVITEAPGVKFDEEQLSAAAAAVLDTLGPGILAEYNEHIQSRPNKEGIVPGHDGNYTVSQVRQLGPFLYRRRHPQISEYRLLKTASELLRLELQTGEGVYFPQTDRQRDQERKASNKKLRAEELAEDEWSRLLTSSKGGGVRPDFSSQDSVLHDVSQARIALAERGYDIAEQELPASLTPDRDGLAGSFYTISHPDWERRRKENAKKPVKDNAQKPKITIDLTRIVIEGRQLVRQMHQKYLADLAAQKQAAQARDSAPQPALPAGPEEQATPAPTTEAGAAETATREPAVPLRPEFLNDEYLIPLELIRAVENLPPRQVMQDAEDAGEVLRAAGWPVADEAPRPHELILKHGEETIRVRQDEALFVIQMAILRANLRRHPDWSVHADLNITPDQHSGKAGDLNVYLDCFHPDLMSLQEHLHNKAGASRWIRVSEYTGRAADPVQTASDFLERIKNQIEPRLLSLFTAIHCRTAPAGFLTFAHQVRQRCSLQDLPEPAFKTRTPPPPLPGRIKGGAVDRPPAAPPRPVEMTPLEHLLGYSLPMLEPPDNDPPLFPPMEPAVPAQKREAAAPVIPEPPALTDRDWEDPEKCLAWLHWQARARYHSLITPGMHSFNEPEKLLSRLGVAVREDKQQQTVTLTINEKSITLPRYRFQFAIASGCTHAECGSFGLVLPLPTPRRDSITIEEREIAVKVSDKGFLNSSLWPETLSKLQKPHIQQALKDVWPEICAEPDEVTKATRLMHVLKVAGQFTVGDHFRIAFALLDPLAQQFHSVGPKALGIVKECQPKAPRPEISEALTR